MDCPTCGRMSLSEIVDHSCRLCAKDYAYCPRCIIAMGTEDLPGLAIKVAKTAGIQHEVEDE